MVTIEVIWAPPAVPNGIVSGYQYTLTSTDEGGATGNTADTSVTVNVTVSPYTNYTLTVRASTSAGVGCEAVETALSPEACKYHTSEHQCVMMRNLMRNGYMGKHWGVSNLWNGVSGKGPEVSC